MMKRIFRDVLRLMQGGLFFALGAVLAWRGMHYSSPKDTSLLAPVLCVILAFVLGITGITVAVREGDIEKMHEQTPARQN